VRYIVVLYEYQIIIGAMTVFVSTRALFIFPNFPRTTSWPTPKEGELAAQRLEGDADEADDDYRSVFPGGGFQTCF